MPALLLALKFGPFLQDKYLGKALSDLKHSHEKLP